MRRWWVLLPGAVYANGTFRASDLQGAKQWVRDWLGINRLPRGTQVWEQVGPAWWERG